MFSRRRVVVAAAATAVVSCRGSDNVVGMVCVKVACPWVGMVC